MGKRVMVPLVDGIEELEAVTVVDLLRRAEVDVVTAGLAEGPVRASRGVVFVPDQLFATVAGEPFDGIVFPGGAAGAEKLESDPRILDLARDYDRDGHLLAAVCAAPRVLAAAGVLQGRRATAYPGHLEAKGIEPEDQPVVVDGNIVTSRGPGTAMDFALTLIEYLEGVEVAADVEAALQRPAPHRKYS